MRYSVSDTPSMATNGWSQDHRPETRAVMQELLTDIRSGKFADQWMAENTNGRACFNSCAPATSNTRSSASAASCAHDAVRRTKEVVPGQGGA